MSKAMKTDTILEKAGGKGTQSPSGREASLTSPGVICVWTEMETYSKMLDKKTRSTVIIWRRTLKYYTDKE